MIIITLAAALAALLAYKLIVYPLFLSPLARLPGPLSCHLSIVPHLLARATTGNLPWASALHARYGPVVRIAPNEVSLAGPDAFHAVHGMGTRFTKGPVFDVIKGRDRTASLFLMRDPAAHARRRRLFARGFTTSSLRKHWEGAVRDKVDMAARRMREEAREGTTDMYTWWRLMAGDVIATIAFGESTGMLERGERTRFVVALEDSANAMIVSSVLRVPLWVLRSVAPTRRLRAVFEAPEVTRAFGHRAVRNMRYKVGEDAEDDDLPPGNLIGEVLRAAEREDKGQEVDDKRAVVLSEAEIAAEATAFMVAGSDTTANALAYAAWNVMKRPALRARLEAELDALPPAFTSADLESGDGSAAPLLNAVIDETMRLHSPAAGFVPRVVAPEGYTTPGEGSYFLPAGTTVFTTTWASSRNDAIWPDARTFDETRWLRKEGLTDAQRRAYSPYGVGSRSCIGVQLARMELRLALAVFFRECKGVRLARTTTEESMELIERFLLTMRGQRCDVTARDELAAVF